MKKDLKVICDEFLVYQDMVKDQYFGGYRTVYPVCAYIYLAKREVPNLDFLRYCKALMKKEFGAFSSFRSYGEKIFTVLLAIDPEPERKLALSLAAYQFLRTRFHGSAFLPLLALWMTDNVVTDDYVVIAEKTNTIYRMMNEEHFFLTTSEDVPFAGLLAMTDRDEPAIIREMEYIFDRLNKRFPFHKNAMQTLSQALTLCYGDPDEKCDNLFSLYSKLENKGIRYSKSYEIAILGILANIGIDHGTILRDFSEVDKYLAKQGGYGFLGFGKRSRYMHTVMILMSYHMANNIEAVNAVILAALLEIQESQQAAAAAA